jgi:hypothetical protein
MTGTAREQVGDGDTDTDKSRDTDEWMAECATAKAVPSSEAG